MPPDTNPPRPLPEAGPDPIEDDEAERLLLIAAVEEARNDPSPDVPHEVVRDEMLQDIARLRAKVEAMTGRPLRR